MDNIKVQSCDQVIHVILSLKAQDAATFWPIPALAAVTGAGCWQAGCGNRQCYVHIQYCTRAAQKNPTDTC